MSSKCLLLGGRKTVVSHRMLLNREIRPPKVFLSIWTIVQCLTTPFLPLGLLERGIPGAVPEKRQDFSFLRSATKFLFSASAFREPA